MTILADLKTMLEISGTDFDTILGNIIDGIKEEAYQYMDIKYDAIVDNIQYFDGGESIYYLDHANVSSLSLSFDGTAMVAGNDQDYVLYPDRGKIKIVDGPLDEGFRLLVATYSGGYAEDSIPNPLRSKLIKQMGYEFRRRKDPGLSSVSYPNGGVSKYSIDEWLNDVKAVLDKYKRMIF